jgi:hypothetical protein
MVSGAMCQVLMQLQALSTMNNSIVIKVSLYSTLRVLRSL